MEEEEKGISIGEIFKVIFKRVWWVIGATAAVLIAFLCIIQFWYNPNEQTYSATYEVRLPSGNVYPDGTELDVGDAVLLSNLQIIKSESLLPEAERTGRFANVDVEEMVREDDIHFVQEVVQNQDGTYRYINSVSIVRKYFKNKEQGADFVRAVAEYTVYNAQKVAERVNYTERLSRYDKYSTYEDKINALVEQKDYIVDRYNEILALYSGEYVPAGMNSVKTIGDYLLDLTNVFGVSEQEKVRNTVSANYYVYDTEAYKESANAKIKSLELEIANNENIIEALKQARNDLITSGDIMATEAYEVQIAEYTVENANKKNEIVQTKKTLEEIEKYASGEAKQAKDAFDAHLTEIRAQLEEQAQTLKAVNIATFKEKAQVIYSNNKIKAEGGMNIILAAVIGLVLGFVLVSAVILIIDLPKYKRGKYAAPAEENQEETQKSEENE